MMQLTVKHTGWGPRNRISPLPRVQFDILNDAINEWPGILSYWHGFTDPMLDRYDDLQQAAALEMIVAEEEDDDYMDATAQSASTESESLEASGDRGEASVQDDGSGAIDTEISKGAAHHGSQREGECAPTSDGLDSEGPALDSNDDEAGLHTDTHDNGVGATELGGKKGVSSERVHSTDLSLLKVTTR